MDADVSLRRGRVPRRADGGLATGDLQGRRRVDRGGRGGPAGRARRAGAHTFIMPRKNENDLELIPDELRQGLKIVLVDRITEVLPLLLVTPPVPKVVKKRPLRQPPIIPPPPA